MFGGIKPLAPTTIDRYKKIAYTKANLPNITQHEFRHSYATRNIYKKVPIDIVSRSMGHSKVSTTLDVYLYQEKNTFNVFSS
ncbi:MAG: tyrosine-type recombinase/integrase [Bacilli bacterium]|nr:tyrosine-type recombinase/integrase [Bacilli bacterium]